MKNKFISALLLLCVSSYAGIANYIFENQSNRPHRFVLATVKAFNPNTQELEDLHVKFISLPSKTMGNPARVSGQIPVNAKYIYPAYIVRHVSHPDGAQTNMHTQRRRHLTIKCTVGRDHRSTCKTSR